MNEQPKPKFYKRWWFWALALAVGIAGFLAYYYGIIGVPVSLPKVTNPNPFQAYLDLNGRNFQGCIKSGMGTDFNKAYGEGVMPLSIFQTERRCYNEYYQHIGFNTPTQRTFYQYLQNTSSVAPAYFEIVLENISSGGIETTSSIGLDSRYLEFAFATNSLNSPFEGIAIQLNGAGQRLLADAAKKHPDARLLILYLNGKQVSANMLNSGTPPITSTPYVFDSGMPYFDWESSVIAKMINAGKGLTQIPQ